MRPRDFRPVPRPGDERFVVDETDGTVWHRCHQRALYADTDRSGVVYHANYLRYLERARTELLGSFGPSVQDWTHRGLIFPIYSINITFKAPARLCDDLVVVTLAKRTSPYRVSFDQRIERPADGKLLVEAKVDAVCTDLQGSLREFPDLGMPAQT